MNGDKWVLYFLNFLLNQSQLSQKSSTPIILAPPQLARSGSPHKIGGVMASSDFLRLIHHIHYWFPPFLFFRRFPIRFIQLLPILKAIMTFWCYMIVLCLCMYVCIYWHHIISSWCHHWEDGFFCPNLFLSIESKIVHINGKLQPIKRIQI